MPLKYKMFLIVLLVFSSVLICCSCTGANSIPPITSPEQQGSIKPLPNSEMPVEPEPTPEPTRILIVADCVEQEAADFFRGATDALNAKHFIAESFLAPDGFSNYLTQSRVSGYDGLIALCTKEDSTFEALAQVIDWGLQLALTDMRPQKDDVSIPNGDTITSESVEVEEPLLNEEVVPKSAAYARYEQSDVEALALDIALAYPPHNTPVRLIALFSASDSPAANAFSLGVKEGRILPKSIYYASSSKQNVADFLTKQLARYVEGMIDAIYCENTELALAALEVLREQGRTDMEVFSVPYGTLFEQRSLYDKWTFPVAMGADLFEAGVQAAEDINALLAGKQPEHRVFAPSVSYPALNEKDAIKSGG